MSYKVLPTKEFSKDFKKLDSQLKIKTKKKIEELSLNPKRYKFLHYDTWKRPYSNLKVGDECLFQSPSSQ